MSRSDQTGTQLWDIAVDFSGVTKTYEQWKRLGTVKNMIKNLLKPEKVTITALNNVTFSVKRGEFVAYAGPNGAGKSTTIKLIAGMLTPLSGCIEVMGRSPLKQRISLMREVGVLFGNRTELWWDHPVNMSFEWKKAVWGIDENKYKVMRDMVVELLDIGGLLDTFTRELSLGQRMRCDLAMMLLHEPELILLDEPTLGLDVLAKRQMISFLKQLNKEKKTTIIVTSHDMDDLEEMARRILLIESGNVAFDGNFLELRSYMGCQKKMRIMTSTSDAPVLTCAGYLDSNKNIHNYKLNVDIEITAVLRELSELSESVLDIEFSQASLEESLADLFRAWGNGNAGLR